VDAENLGEEPSRDTIPSGIDLKQTLPTGAAFHATWKMPAWRPNTTPPAASDHESGSSGVRKLDLPPEAVDPHARESFNRTIRMEFGVHVASPSTPAPAAPQGPHNDPRDTLEPEPPISPTRKAAFSKSGDTVMAFTVQRIGDDVEANRSSSERGPSQRPTDPFGHPSQRPPQPTLLEGLEQPDVVSEVPPSTATVSSETPSERVRAAAEQNTARPWGDVRQQYEYNAEFDDEPPRWLKWLSEPWKGKRLVYAGIAGGALIGVFVLLGLAEDDDDFDEDMSMQQEGTVDPQMQAATGQEPHVVMPAPLPGTAPAASTTVDAPPANAAIADSTEIVTEPSNAELVRGGAIVANTPTRVARPKYETDYLLRMEGYDTQLVRIGPTSPARIVVQMKTAKPSPATAATPETKPTPAPETKPTPAAKPQ
jgi:hypothetical protein